MKALQLEKPQSWKRIDIAEPAAPGPGEALLRVHRIGICGTDISGYLGKMPFFSYPRIPGHELGVEVLAVGDGVTNVKPGDRCLVETCNLRAGSVKNGRIPPSRWTPRTCSFSQQFGRPCRLA